VTLKSWLASIICSENAAIEGRLAKFKLPKPVVFVDDLPRNTLGKVLKNLLSERFSDRYTAKAA
jgi:malonyl-CoA/methylmalonyl-CoA synthetase